jgi:hypothetical protein
VTKLCLPVEDPRQRLAACGKWRPLWHPPVELRLWSLVRRQEWAKSAAEMRRGRSLDGA